MLFKCKPVSFRSRVVCGGETVALACPPSQPDFRSSCLQYFYHFHNFHLCTRCIKKNQRSLFLVEMTSHTDHRLLISDWPFFPLLLERRPPGTSSAPPPAIMSDLGSALAFLRTGEFSLKLDRFFSRKKRLDCPIIWYLNMKCDMYDERNITKTVKLLLQPLSRGVVSQRNCHWSSSKPLPRLPRLQVATLPNKLLLKFFLGNLTKPSAASPPTP